MRLSEFNAIGVFRRRPSEWVSVDGSRCLWVILKLDIEVTLTILFLPGSREAVVPAHLRVEPLRILFTTPWNWATANPCIPLPIVLSGSSRCKHMPSSSTPWWIVDGWPADQLLVLSVCRCRRRRWLQRSPPRPFTQMRSYHRPSRFSPSLDLPLLWTLRSSWGRTTITGEVRVGEARHPFSKACQ